MLCGEINKLKLKLKIEIEIEIEIEIFSIHIFFIATGGFF